MSDKLKASLDTFFNLHIPTLFQLWYIQVNSGIYRSTLVYTGQLWYIQVNSGIYSQLWYIQVNSLPFLLCPFPLTLSKKISYAKINCIRQTASDKLHQTNCIRQTASDKLHQTNCIRQTVSDKLHQTNCIRQNIPTYSAKKETNRSFKNCKVPCHLSLYN